MCSSYLSCSLGIGRGRRLQSLWEEFITSGRFCLLPSSTMSGALPVREAIALDLINTPPQEKKDPCHVLRCLRGNHQDSNPLPESTFPRLCAGAAVEEPGCHHPALLSFATDPSFCCIIAPHPWPALQFQLQLRRF